MASTRKCPRCQGKAAIRQYLHVLGGICLACNGTGEIEVLTATERQAREAAWHRRCALIRTLNDRAKQLGRSTAFTVADARDHLETNAPDRHARLLDSVERGRTDAVIAALLTYAAEHVYTAA